MQPFTPANLTEGVITAYLPVLAVVILVAWQLSKKNGNIFSSIAIVFGIIFMFSPGAEASGLISFISLIGMILCSIAGWIVTRTNPQKRTAAITTFLVVLLISFIYVPVVFNLLENR